MKNCFGRVVTTIVLLGMAASAQAIVVYSEDWESGTVGSEWTTNTGSLVVDTAPGGQKILGADDGLAEGLSSQSVTLALSGLAAHTYVTVSFDFIAIDSLDSSEPFTVAVDGSTEFGPVYFINRSGGPTESSDPGATGAPVSLDTHQFPPVNVLSRSDAVYRISFTVPHTDAALDVAFAMSGMQDILDESWSLDNILVETDGTVTPPPPPPPPPPTFQPTPVPTMSLLGLMLMVIILVAFGTWSLRSR